MAAYLLHLNPTRFLSVPSAHFLQNGRRCQPIKCSLKKIDKQMEVSRRSANYPTTICGYDFIQSLRSDYGEPTYRRRAERLRDYAKRLLEEVDKISSLELIDTLQRLGISYHFDEEIKQVIEDRLIEAKKEDDLHYTALRFRILRQHGHMIPQDEFIPFLDKNGGFKEALRDDTKAVLSLYDASYLAMEGETILDDARAFATRHLKDHLKGNSKSELHKLAKRGLELPHYWRTPRQEAQWSIDAYERMQKKNPELLELAKLDYNICQAGYQSNVKTMSRWWKDRGLAEKLPFSRDRLPECFLWGMETISRPQYAYATEGLTLVSQLITTIDDIYDVYGTIEELELFTHAVERWDLQVLEELPCYMRHCYLALFNFLNEIGYRTLNLQGCNIIPFLKKKWEDLCKAYLMEAKWFYYGYKPTLEEYINNAWVSISTPALLSSLFFLMNQEITKERLVLLDTCPDLMQGSSLALRLINDLATANAEQSRGDVLKVVQCYMHEKGVSEEIACELINQLINESWKKMNKHLILGSSFPRDFVISAMDHIRMAHSYYTNGDGYGSMRTRTLDLFKSLVVEPIQLVDVYIYIYIYI